MKIYKEIKNAETGAKDYKPVTGREDVLQVAASLIAHHNLVDAGVDDMIMPHEITRAVAEAMYDEILVIMLEKNLLK